MIRKLGGIQGVRSTSPTSRRDTRGCTQMYVFSLAYIFSPCTHYHIYPHPSIPAPWIAARGNRVRGRIPSARTCRHTRSPYSLFAFYQTRARASLALVSTSCPRHERAGLNTSCESAGPSQRRVMTRKTHTNLACDRVRMRSASTFIVTHVKSARTLCLQLERANPERPRPGPLWTRIGTCPPCLANTSMAVSRLRGTVGPWFDLASEWVLTVH